MSDGKRSDSVHVSCSESVLDLTKTTNILTAVTKEKAGEWIFRVDTQINIDPCKPDVIVYS